MRYLTKSRFTTAMECPTKLYYEGKREYANQALEDSFLQALADGGFQVGELARCYHPEGIKVDANDTETAIQMTNELMQKENVTIFEGAFRAGNLLIRVDILKKQGDHVSLMEVKAKSYHALKDGNLLNKKNEVSSKWMDKIYDVGFQRLVLARSYPELSIDTYLLLPDKNKACPTDGLHQKFKITRLENGRKTVVLKGQLTDEEMIEKILIPVKVNKAVEALNKLTFDLADQTLGFQEMVDALAEAYQQDQKAPPKVGMKCKSCEYHAKPEDAEKGYRSGFKTCWKEALGWREEDFEDPLIFEIWNFRKAKSLLEKGMIKLKDLDTSDFEAVSEENRVLTTSQRQGLQVVKTVNKDPSPWINREGLRREMDSWTYPLHMIDFETSAMAIPFHQGMRPYEGIAFQFSHHIIHKDGRVEHKGEYLNDQPGDFPNFKFVRALKKELEKDSGTIFRYAAHENTYLNMIYQQLSKAEDVKDQEALMAFIQSITQSTKNASEAWVGSRNMVDLLELVKKYYYDPRMKGSNSIKKVLPAVLNQSDFLKEKYGHPIYGSEDGIKSLNYDHQTWIKYHKGEVMDPYKLLPPMFQDSSDHDQEMLIGDNVIADGGAALVAYARLQFEDIPTDERQEIRKALLKYCELDTLAMVMIVEGWGDWVDG